jgi:hypothetical protein
MSKYVIDEQTLITVANAYKRGKSPDVFLADNKLTPQPILYIDYVDNGTADNLYSKVDENLIEYGYEKNNEGILTPVAYTNENHVDKYFYLGKTNLSGITGTFDQWQKIETDSYEEGSHGWEINKCYIYTKPFMLSLDFNDLESDLNSLIAPFENPVEVAIPSIALDTTKGEITSTTTQEMGYCKGGTQTETVSLPIMEPDENPIIPRTYTQKAASAGYFVTEDIKVAPIPDAWVKPTNTITTTSKTLEGRTGEFVTISGGSYVKNDYTIYSTYTPKLTLVEGDLVFTPKGTCTTKIASGKFTSFRLVIEPGRQGEDPLTTGQIIVSDSFAQQSFDLRQGHTTELMLVNGNTLILAVYSSASSIKSYEMSSFMVHSIGSNLSISIETTTNWSDPTGYGLPTYSLCTLS